MALSASSIGTSNPSNTIYLTSEMRDTISSISDRIRSDDERRNSTEVISTTPTRNTILNEAERTQSATSSTLKRIGAIASGAAVCGGAGAVVGWVFGPPGSATGIVAGAVAGAIIGAGTGECIYRSCCRYQAYEQWENRISREYTSDNVNETRPSAEALKIQLMEVFEEDEILSKYIDPISFSLVQYPFEHPISKQICDLNTYKMAIASGSGRRAPPKHPTHPSALLCPLTQVPLNMLNTESFKENVYIQAAICNRLVYLVEASSIPGLHEEVVRGLNEIKADFDRIRNTAYENRMKDIQHQKETGAITISVYQQKMVQLTQRFFQNTNFDDVDDTI